MPIRKEPSGTSAQDALHIGILTHDPRNARKHTPRNVGTIVSALHEVGAARSIVIDEDGVVLAGNATLDAAAEAGITKLRVVETDGTELVAVKRTGLSAEQKTRLALYDNRAAELAEWDAEVLKDLAQENMLGGMFTADELQALLPDLLEQKPLADPDDIPEPPATPITQQGDLWLLGEHRLLCGDSTRTEDVDRLMNGAKADMLLSDPPYGVSYVGKTKDALKVENDELNEQNLTALIVAAFDNAETNCRAGAYWYATVPAGPLHTLFAEDWKRRGILRQIMVWAKDSMVLGHSEYHYQHEPILFGWIPGDRHKNSDRTRTTLWQYDRPKANREHPTMKPVALWAQAVTDGSRNGEIVFDPFLGSGTTVIAAEQLGRKCYGMEISPQYCDVIIKRWEQVTGKTAIRQTA
jgi:site-specific DNA-methyltransferase (adenine-specific)